MADPRQVQKPFSIMGSSFIAGATGLIDRLKPGQPLKLSRQPNNPADPNAVAILWGDRGLGFVPRGLAAEIAPIMDSGIDVICRKAPPLPRFGAYRGILELAYIPADVPDPANATGKAAASESPDKAASTGSVSPAASRGIPKGENFPDDFDE